MSQPRVPHRTLLILAAVGFALVVAIDAWLHLVGPLPGDRASVARIEGGFGAFRPGVKLDVLYFFQTLGTPALALPMAAFLVWTATTQFGRRAGLLVVLAAGCVVANAVAKHVFGPTPLLQDIIDATPFPGRRNALNFPSGHVAYATSLFGAVAYLASRDRRWDLAVPAIAIVVAMGPARVIGGSHFVSDVVAGYLFGGAWLLVSIVVVARWTPASWARPRPPARPRRSRTMPDRDPAPPA